MFVHSGGARLAPAKPGTVGAYVETLERRETPEGFYETHWTPYDYAPTISRARAIRRRLLREGKAEAHAIRIVDAEGTLK